MKPRFIERYRVCMDDNDMLISSGRRHIRASGGLAPLLSRVLPTLNGRYSAEQIAGMADVEVELIDRVVSRLAQARIVSNWDGMDTHDEEKPSDSIMKPHKMAISWLAPEDPACRLRLLATFPVSVVSDLSAAESLLIDALAASGFSASRIDLADLSANSGVRCVVCLACHEDIGLFRRVNRMCRERDIPWLRVIIEPERVRVGPLFVHGDTPCYDCLITRSVSASPCANEYVEYLRAGDALSEEPVQSYLTGGAYFVSGLISVELVKYATGIAGVRTIGYEIDVDLLTLEAKLHPVLRVPPCGVCGSGPFFSSTHRTHPDGDTPGGDSKNGNRSAN